MSDAVDIIEIELDPGGYAPRPDLWVRNLSPFTITFNLGRVKWELPTWPNPSYEQALPWTAARSPGFQRIWEREQVLVATDSDFSHVITDLPTSAALFRPFVHHQVVPQATVDIVHGQGRDGPVQVVVYSLDGQIEYWNFHVEMMSPDIVRISFDDPISFVATVF